MARFSRQAGRPSAARRGAHPELRSIYVGGLTLLTVLYVVLGLALGYVPYVWPQWQLPPEVVGWYWILGFGAVMTAAVAVWVMVAMLSREEAEGDSGETSPAADRWSPGRMPRLVSLLAALTVALFGFSLGVATYFEWAWWRAGQAQTLWAFGAWTLALGLVVGFALVASGVAGVRREAHAEAEALIAAADLATPGGEEEAAPPEAASPDAAPPEAAPARPALPPHRTAWPAIIGRAVLIIIWIALIALATWLEIRFEAEGSSYRYLATTGLAVVAIIWWAVREALIGLGRLTPAPVVRRRAPGRTPGRTPGKMPVRVAGKTRTTARRRRFIMPESSLTKKVAKEEVTSPVPLVNSPTPAIAPAPKGSVREAPAQPSRPPVVPVEPPRKVGAQARTWVGLDIGSRTMKVVQIAPGKPRPVIVNFASAPTPERSVKDGVIIRPTAVADAVTELLQKAGIRQRRVIAALGGQAVILRQAQFPMMPPAELREALKWEAEQHIPIPAEDAIVDFVILGEGAGAVAAATGGPRSAPAAGPQSQGQAVVGPAMQVLLVATQKRIVDGYVDVFEAARLRPVALEVDLLAIHRALRSNDYLDEEGRPVAILNVGAASAGLSLFANHAAQLTRTIPAGGEVFVQSIAEAFQETPAGAEALLREHGVKPLTPIARCVQPVVDELALEVRRSLEFYLIKNRQQAIKQLFVVGGAAVIPGLAEVLSEALNEAFQDKNPGGQPIEVIVPDPARRLPVAGTARARLAEFGSEYMQAVGLALREESPE